jgi:YafQ family addiction module toxin component
MTKYTKIISPKLQKTLKKLEKKDLACLIAIDKKVEEICIDPTLYKNLNYPLNAFKEVHICTHFVLYFSVDENEKTVTFEKFEHHK